MNTIKLKRIAAWIIDWNLCGIPCLLYSLFFSDVVKQPHIDEKTYAFMLFFILLVIFYPLSFILRDIIFKGRSVGKRLFGLCVVDCRTNLQASSSQRITRNLFFFLCFADGIILLVTGQSIGDRVANTAVTAYNRADDIRTHSKYGKPEVISKK